MRWVALLRGINVGGKNKLPMRDLSVMFSDAGCSDVRTYIQSGNVVFGAGARLAKQLPLLIEGRIAKQFGLRVPVLLRSQDELEAVTRGNPFLAAGSPADGLHVLFLADEPDAKSVASLDPQRSPPDEFVVRGKEIYLRCPNGMGRTKLTNDWFDRHLAATSSARNWRTVLALLELAKA